jgi:hypothetical protein
MSGKGNGGKPRKFPGVFGRRPDRRAQRQTEAEERRLKHEAEGSPRSRKKRLAAQKAKAA